MDELIKRLRYCRDNAAVITDDELMAIADQAADAVEELSRENASLLIAQKPTIKRRIVYRGAVYNALEAERINHLDGILTDRYKDGFHDGIKRALEILGGLPDAEEGE